MTASRPMTAPCTTHRCPTVAPSPMTTGSCGPWMTVPSCTLAPALTTIGPKSPRSTAPYQTDAPASIVTSPTIDAVGATHASGWTSGCFPSKANSGMAATLVDLDQDGFVDLNVRVTSDEMCAP